MIYGVTKYCGYSEFFRTILRNVSKSDFFNLVKVSFGTRTLYSIFIIIIIIIISSSSSSSSKWLTTGRKTGVRTKRQTVILLYVTQTRSAV
jgi:hypothetical protein